MILRALALLLPFLIAATAWAQPAGRGAPITIGQSYKLKSELMGAERTINVWLPPGYADSGKRYPVLYLLDGGVEQDFLHIAGLAQLGTIIGTTRDLILVGVESVDRRNELTPVTADPALRKQYPTAGEAGRFRRFLMGEVRPWVDKHYRTNGDDGLIGESLAGLFVTETFVRNPGSFDRYIAISPSLWWDKEQLSKEAEPLVTLPVPGERWLWLAIANEGVEMPEMKSGMDRLVRGLKKGPKWVHWSFNPMPRETHATIYHPAALAAIRALYPPETQQ